MRRSRVIRWGFAAALATWAALPAHASLTVERVNAAASPPAEAIDGETDRDPSILKAQVLLDRAGFSPGVIDGRNGINFQRALRVFQEEFLLERTGRLDEATWQNLIAISIDPVLVEYKISAADVSGPFAPNIPDDWEAMARLKRLSYRSPLELLAEKFHMDEGLLRALNPEATFRESQATIVVANVQRAKPAGKAARVQVDKAERSVRVLDEYGKVIAFFPASVGSEEKTVPNGRFRVNSTAAYPVYHYNPAFKFPEVKSQRGLTFAPGPNNPVGVIWIGLTAQTYGIHGTPEPGEVGKALSHGCIRLTNWDAVALSKMVRRGTRVRIIDSRQPRGQQASNWISEPNFP